MKKYTNYKIGLCIGLLGLNLLSSCTNMRQELGAGEILLKPLNSAQKFVYRPSTKGDFRRSDASEKCSIVCGTILRGCVLAGVVVVAGTIFVGLPIYYSIYGIQPNALTSDSILGKCLGNVTDVSLSRNTRSISLYDTSAEQGDRVVGLVRDAGVSVLGVLGGTLGALYYGNGNNATSRNTSSVPLSDATMSEEQGDRIMRFIRDAGEKFGSNDTDSSTAEPDTKGSEGTEAPKGLVTERSSQVSSGNSDTTEPVSAGSVTTTDKPNGGPAAGNITVIGEKTMKRLEELKDKDDEDSAINFIKCLFNENLDVNAKNSEKCTPYAWSVKNNMTKVFEFLNDNPNVNKSATC